MMPILIQRNIGVRAEGMMLAAGIWCLIGVGALSSDSPDHPGAWHLLWPAGVRATIWCVAAVAAAISAPSERWSNIGLGLLTVPPMITVCSYLTGWVYDLIPGPPPGDPGGWYRASYYVAMIALVILLSHIPANVQAPLSGRRR